MTGEVIIALRAFARCARSGGHDFTDTVCRRCGAEKDGKSLAEILAEKGKRP